MPAVDYRLPGGLTFEELQTVLTTLLASNKVIGLDLAIYNPKLDPQGTFEYTRLIRSGRFPYIGEVV